MHAITKITAAIVISGAASIATSARATEVCEIGASLYGNALDLRLSGISHDTARALTRDSIIASLGGMSADDQVAMITEGAPALLAIVDGAYAIPFEPIGDPAEAIADLANAFLEGCEGESL